MNIDGCYLVSGINVENGNVLLQSPINGYFSSVSGSSGDSSSPVKKEDVSIETDTPPVLPHPVLSQPTNMKCNATTSTVEKAMAGWSLATAGSVRIGDLYLMVSTNSW